MRISRKTWHQIHKWPAVAVGIFFLIWTVSGIVMMLPRRWFQPSAIEPAERVSFRDANISPGEAVERLESKLGRALEVSGIGIGRIGESVTFEIFVIGEGPHLVDAQSGDLLTITPSIAEQIVVTAIPELRRELEVERIEKHDLLYPFGTLPVYRVSDRDRPGEVYYVSPYDGSLSRSTWMTRAHGAVISLHTFEPMRLLFEQDRVRKASLALAGGVGVGVALTGYLLALLPYLRGRS